MHHMELTFTNFQRVNYYYNEDRINKSHCVALRGKMIASICTTYRMFVCSFPMQANTSLCPSSMLAFRQKCYQGSDFNLGFWKAEEQCCNGGGHLASIPDLETLELVTSNFSSGTDISMWVGIHFVEENKTYVNMLNETQNYTDWAQGQPVVSVLMHARDVAIYKAKWYADFGNRLYPSVCSRRTACQGSELPSNTVKELSNPFPGNFSETLFDFGSELFQYDHGLVISLVCQKTGFWEQFTTNITYCLCPCSRVCVSLYLQNNMSSVVKKMVDIRNQLLLEKSSLTSTRRQKISMADPRRSAFAVGSMLGIGIITAVVLIIVISDLPLLRCQRCLKSKVKP
uniref:Uncharacterized protein LOC111123424 n=1 Tax=Crassostrea virginica TaxID=6565 RepID=A0A8B8D3Q2_CRAVI|nr:uncharacterized protein LOC111123424 [Crassostrea virginica]